MLPNNSLYGNYRTRTFSEIYPTKEEFINDYKQVYPDTMKEDKLSTLYYLLLSKYANSHIINTDENQFKLKAMSTIFCYGPTWAKRIDIQKKLRELSESDLLTGSKAIYNHASNPSTIPSTGSKEELIFIDEQNTQAFKKGKLDAYTLLWEMLRADVTTEFLGKFKNLFIVVVLPESPLWYASDDEEEED